MASDPPDHNPTSSADAGLEGKLHFLASTFAYPPTPDLAAVERLRLAAAQVPQKRRIGRYAWALVILALLAALLLVTPVRARLLDWIRIGAVQIFLVEPTPSPTPESSLWTPTPPAASLNAGPQTATPLAVPSATTRQTASLLPTPTPLQSVLDLAGETNLVDAATRAGFTILLPSSPANLGQPDHVYFQDFGGPVVVLVWMDPLHPAAVHLSLSEALSDHAVFQKYMPQSVLDTRVGSQPAVWIDGSYLLITGNGVTTLSRLVEQGHTLIWTAGKMTFRLETDTDLATAIATAESIH